MLKRFFSRLRSSRRVKSERKKNKKTIYFWKTRRGKLGLGISAAILLIVVILFSKQIDNLLRLWGIKANGPGEITVNVTDRHDGDSIANVWPEDATPSNIAEFNIEFDPDQPWAVDGGDGVTEVRITGIEIIPPLEESDYIDRQDISFSQDLTVDPLVFTSADPGPKSITMTVVTHAASHPIGLNEYLDFIIIPKGGFEYIKGGGDPVSGEILGVLGSATIRFNPGVRPDFAISIIPDAEDDYTVIGGELATYTVTLTALNNFVGSIDLTSPELADALADGSLTEIEGLSNPVVFASGDISKDITLILHTAVNPVPNPPIAFSFDVIGTTDDIAEGDTTSHTTSSFLRINTTPPGNFSITTAFDDVNSPTPNPWDPDGIIRTVPGGTIVFRVTVNRQDGWTGEVTATTDLFTNPKWTNPDRISSIKWKTFPDNTASDNIFNAGTAVETKLLFISIVDNTTIDPEEFCIDIDFYIKGTGVIGGVSVDRYDKPTGTEGSFFKITDYELTIKPETKTVPADVGTTTYRVYVETFNEFVDSELSLRVLSTGRLDIFDPTHPHILGVDVISTTEISSSSKFYAINIKFNINPASSGTIDGDLVFQVEGRSFETSLIRISINEGYLNITTAQDFSIEVTRNRFSPDVPDPDVPDYYIKTVAGGTVIFDVTLIRFNGWTGTVTATHNLLTNWPDDISSATWATSDPQGRGLFNPGISTLTLTVQISPNAEWVGDNYIDFTVTGEGDIDGTTITHDDAPTDQSAFWIIGFSITILEPTEQTVPATLGGGDPSTATYRVRIDTSAQFWGDDIAVSLVPANFMIINKDYIAKIDGLTPTQLSDDEDNYLFDLTFEIKSTSPSTPPEGLRFQVLGINSDIGITEISNEGILHIINTQDFRLTVVAYEGSNPVSEPAKVKASPGNTLTFMVTLTRWNGYPEGVLVTSDLLANWPGDIASVSFQDGGYFSGTSVTTQHLLLTVQLSRGANYQYIDFTVTGVGERGGIPDPINMTRTDQPSQYSAFAIVGFSITIKPPEKEAKIGIDSTVTYNVTVGRSLAQYGWDIFSDYVTLKLLPDNLVNDNSQYLLGTSTLPSVSWIDGINDFFFNLDFYINQNAPDNKDISFNLEGTGMSTGLIRGSTPDNILHIIKNPEPEDPSFTVSIVPVAPGVYAHPGDSGNLYTVTVTPNNGFGGTGDADTITLSHTIPNVPGTDLEEVSFRDQTTGAVVNQLTFTTETAQTVWLYIKIKDTASTSYNQDFFVSGVSYDYNPSGDIRNSNVTWLHIDNWPNYTLALNPSTLTVVAGQNADYTVIVNRDAGLTEDIIISISESDISNLTGIVDYYFIGMNQKTITVGQLDPNPILRFETDAGLISNVTNTTFTVRGNNPGHAAGNHEVTGILNINRQLSPSFTVILHGPNIGDIPIGQAIPGGSAIYTVEVAPIDGFTGRVDLSHNLTDSYIDLSNPITGTRFASNYIDFAVGETTSKTTTLTVVSTPTSQSDHNPIIFVVIGQSGSVGPYNSNNGTFNIITIPDFYLLIPSSQMALRGQTANYTLKLVRQNGFGGAVDLTREFDIALINTLVIGGGVTRFEPSTIDQELNVAVTSFANANAEDTVFTIKGTAVGVIGEKSASATLEISNFSIVIRDPDKSVVRGEDAIYTIDLIRENGFNRAITLSTSIEATYLPNLDSNPVFGNGGIFSANTADQITTLTFSTSITANLLTIPFSVIGTDNISSGFSGQTREDNGNLTIIDNTPGTPDFTITVTPESRTIEPGGGTTYIITVTRINGFSENIVLSTDLLTNNPDEILQIVFIADPANPGITTLQVRTKDTARSSTDPITFNVFGTTTTITRSDSADLIIYKATDSGGGGGGGGGGDPVIPPTPPIVPPIVPPIEAPRKPDVEIPETLPSTGPEMWLWLGIIALIFIGTNQIIGRDRDTD